MRIREAQFALRVVRRREGNAAVLYRRTLDAQGQERLTRVGTIGTLAFTAGTPLLRAAVQASTPGAKLSTGPFHPLDVEWGPRVACFALVASGLRDAERLGRAAENLRRADAAEAAWWLGLMSNGNGLRAVRALRILLEAVE